MALNFNLLFDPNDNSIVRRTRIVFVLYIHTRIERGVKQRVKGSGIVSRVTLATTILFFSPRHGPKRSAVVAGNWSVWSSIKGPNGGTILSEVKKKNVSTAHFSRLNVHYAVIIMLSREYLSPAHILFHIFVFFFF